MATGTYYDLPNSCQKIPLKMRADLVMECIHYQSEPYWVIKDPHAQEYYHFNAQEYGVLSKLDGEISFEQMQAWFDKEFSPYRINFRELIHLLSQFFQKSVVVPCRSGTGLGLHEASREKRRKKLQGKLKNVLAIRWKGWDPEWFLKITYPYVGWFFSKPAIVFNVLLVVLAAGWLGFHFQEFYARLPSVWSMIDADNRLTLVVAMVVTKLLHELGHAFANKRVGGECHEIGVMIFFFTPTLYCNTSDSWLATNKWDRIAVALGGIYIELFLFALATFGWWFSDVGNFQSLCLNIMFLCSISGVLMNGNPLLKYDGYYALADWLEIPNLAQKANTGFRKFFLHHGLGIEKEIDQWTSPFNFRIYLAYAIGAFIFRLLLTITIGTFLVNLLQGTGLGNLGLLIAFLAVGSCFVQPVKGLYQYFKDPNNWLHVKKKKMVSIFCLTIVICGLAVGLPLPYYVTTDAVIAPTDEVTVYVSEPGELMEIFVQPGDFVEAGQPIARLKSDPLEKTIINNQQALEQTRIKIKHLRKGIRHIADARRGEREQRNESLGGLLASQESLESVLRILHTHKDLLTIRADQSGVLYGVTIGDDLAETDDEKVNYVSGNPLDRSNLGAWLKRQTEFCRIGSDEKFVAKVVLEQKYNSLLREGQPVTIMLESMPSSRISGEIESVSANGDRPSELPFSLVLGSNLPAVSHARQIEIKEPGKQMTYKDGQTLASTLLQAQVSLRDGHDQIHAGAAGRARIHLGYQTIFWRLKRALQDFLQKSF